MITVNWVNKIVDSDSSILDLPAFKDTIRDLEDDAIGMLYPPIITYKKVDLGGGAFFHAVDFINGYQLRFPNPGTYEIIGNLNADIVPVAGVYVERSKAAAFATTASGSGGLTPELIAMLESFLAIEGHKPGVVAENSPTLRKAGDVELAITGYGTNFTTVQRV